MNMVERVARVLLEDAAKLRNELHVLANRPHLCRDPYSESKDAWKIFEKEARLAIEAMREPTDAMNAAGYAAKDMWPSDRCDNQRELNMSFSKPRWQAMIDAALKEAE